MIAAVAAATIQRSRPSTEVIDLCVIAACGFQLVEDFDIAIVETANSLIASPITIVACLFVSAAIARVRPTTTTEVAATVTHCAFRELVSHDRLPKR